MGFTKTGAGTLTLSGTNANTYSGLTTLSAGVLRFNKASGTNVSAGPVLVSGGTLSLMNNNQMADTTALTNAGGTINFGGFSDTIGSYVQSSGTFTNGNLTASSYALSGGTIAGNLGAGAATNSAGSTALNGTLGANLTVSGGTLTLGSADRITNTAAVTVTGGNLNFGGFADTVSTFTISGGNFTNGTVTATSYALQGGTVAGNLGTGTINASASTALNGTAAATTVNLTGGTLTLGSASRLTGTTPTVNISGGGVLSLGGSESVGTLNLTNGTVSGSGTFTASNYNLEAGTISATLGNGTLTKTNAGTVLLSGSGSTTGTINIGGGVLAVTNGSAIANSATVTLSNIAGATLEVQQSETIGALTGGGTTGGNVNLLSGATLTAGTSGNQTFAGAITNAGNLVKAGTGTLTLTGVNTFSGTTDVGAGRLLVNGTNANSAVTVATGATLGGSGTVGAVTVAGTLAPGNSVGTLSAGSTTFATNGTFELEIYDFTGTAGTAWDLFAITGNLTLSNTVANPFVINLVSMSSTTTPGLSINFNPNVSFTNTFLTYSGSLLGESFASNLFTVNTNNFLNTVNGSFSITNVAGGLALLYTTAFVPSEEYTWNAGSGLWSVAGNWTNNAAPPAEDAKLFFTGPAGVATNNATVTSASGITFTNTSGSITLAGDAVEVGAQNIANRSDHTQTINNNLSAATNLTVTADTADLVLAGNLTNAGTGTTLTFAGASDTTVSGVISGAGAVVKTNAGAVSLDGNNSFTGSFTAGGGTTTVNGTQVTTTVNVTGGTLLLGAADRLDNGATVTVTAGTLDTATHADTIGTLVLSGSGQVSGSGVLTATTYTLDGGTVAGALGAGTANVGGSVALSGTMASTTLNVNSGGTLTLGSSDRIGNSTAVVADGGVLALGANNDTVSSLVLTNSGSVTGSGTLTAATYTLNGGTVGANLGAGTATSSAGTTALNGTLAGDLNVSGGTVNLGSSDRLGNSSAVSLSSGTLGLGANNDTVGSFAITGGTLDGSGTLTAATYALNGGTLTANLGTGTATASSGTTTLNGTLAANLTVNGGTLTLGAANRISESATVAVSSGTLNFGGFADTVSTYTQSGGVFTNGTLTATTYALQGGNVAGNLGTGTINASASTTLNGTANATTVNVTGGTLSLGSAGRLTGTTPTVNVTGGATLALGGNESVGTVNLTNGTISGSGSLTASTYNVESGEISATLAGSGALSKSNSGTATLSGNNSSYSGAITVRDGTLAAAHNNAFGTGTVTVTNGSAVAANGITVGNAFVIGSAGGSEVYYSQDFNGIGSGATASLPAGWKLSAAGQGTTSTFWTNAANLTATTQAASSGSPTAGGAYNWGFSNDTSNRSIGFMSSGGYAEPNSIMFAFTNTTGQALTGLTVAFDYLRFRTNTTAISNVFYVSDSSTTWGSAVATNTWGTGTSGYNFNPTAVSFSNTVDLTIADGAVGYMMWTFDATASANSQGLGLDNFFIYTVGAPTGSGTLGILESGSATYTGAITVNNNGTLTAAAGGTATFSGALGGVGTVTKTGDGRVILSGANTYTNTTLISAGTLQIGDGGTTGSLAASGLITNNGVLAFNRSDDLVQGTQFSSNSIAGTGSLVKLGGGTLTLNRSNSFSGGTVLSNGVLRISQAQALGSGALTQASGASTLQIAGAGTVTNAMSVYNVAFVSGNNTLSGTQTLNNTTYDTASGTTNTLSGNLEGSGGVTKTGAGTLRITGTTNNTFTGNTDVQGGTLVLAKSADTIALSSTNTTNGVRIGSGAVLEIAAANQINNDAGVNLDGGTLRTYGDGAATGNNETVGLLTLSASSTIDLGTGVHSLTFADSSAIAWTGMLTISNWQGSPFASGTAGRIFFGGSSSGLTAGQLSQITFAGYGTGAQLLGDGELVPIPEPEVYAGAAALLLALGWRERRRLRALLPR